MPNSNAHVSRLQLDADVFPAIARATSEARTSRPSSKGLPFMDKNQTDRQTLCNIASSAFEAVSSLLAKDQMLARSLRSEHTTSTQFFREECITASMAATLVEKYPSNVQVTLFTTNEETSNGADWYWRFQRGGLAIHARVQAKRVQRSSFQEEDKNGRIDIDLEQLERLVRVTREDSKDGLSGLAAWVATFARYDATPPCGCSNLNCCTSHSHNGGCFTNQPSVWIAPATDFIELGYSAMPVRKAVENSVRLDCLLPCIADEEKLRSFEGRAKGPEVKGFQLSRNVPTQEECIETIERQPRLRKAFVGAICITV